MHGSDTTARAIAFSHPKYKMRPKRERPKFARHIFASQPNRSTLGDDVQSVLRSREGWGSPQCMDRIPQPGQSHFLIQRTKCAQNASAPNSRGIYSLPNRIEAPWVMMFSQFYAAEKGGAPHNAWIEYHSPGNRIFSSKGRNAPKTRAPQIREAYIRFPTE